MLVGVLLLNFVLLFPQILLDIPLDFDHFNGQIWTFSVELGGLIELDAITSVVLYREGLWFGWMNSRTGRLWSQYLRIAGCYILGWYLLPFGSRDNRLKASYLGMGSVT